MAYTNLLNYFSKQVNLYFDNRLTEESKEELMEAVKCDPECQQIFQQEQTFRNLIRTNIKRECASPELINHIKNKIV